MSPQSKYWGDVSPCPIWIDAPDMMNRDYNRVLNSNAAACLIDDWLIDQVTDRYILLLFQIVYRESSQLAYTAVSDLT